MRKSNAFIVVKLQFGILAITSALILIIAKDALLSTIAGAMINIIGTAIAATIARRKPGETAQSYLSKLVAAKSIKLSAMLILLALTLISSRYDPGFLLLGFCVMILAYWLALIPSFSKNH